jgi:hypothetical protein
MLVVSTLYLPVGNVYGVSDFNILTVGNWGCTSNSQATINNINSKNPELVLGLGDYSYESTPECWFNEIKQFDSKMRISLGNHDVMSKKLLNSYLDHFGLSKQYYSFDFQNVHVITMATELELEVGSEQYNFSKNDLARVYKDPNTEWIIVTMHKPVYTSPNGCSASSCEGSKTMRDTYHPLFDKYGVDLVLEAHMHSYQRSFPIKYNADNPSKPIITSSNKNNYNNPSGEIFAIVATGGINFHSLAGKAPFTASQQDKHFGVLEVKMTNDGNTLVGKFHANGGKVMDEFSITKTHKKAITSPNPVSSTAPIADKSIESESEDTTTVKQNKDTTVKQNKDTTVKQNKDTTSPSKIPSSQPKVIPKNSPQNEIHISDPDTEEEDTNSKTSSDTKSYTKSNEPKPKLNNPFAPIS